MNTFYFGAEGTEENNIYEIKYSRKSGDAHVDFKINQYSGGERNDTFDLVCTGYIKWDGCSNWHTAKNSSLHLCGLYGLNNFYECLKECYKIAKRELGDDCE